jgi:6-phosphogluconolactonase
MKKNFNIILSIAVLSMLLIAGCKNQGGSGQSTESSSTIKFYVGSSDRSLEHSIFLCELDLRTNQFAVLDSFAGAKGPSYLALSPNREFLYSIDKTVSDPDAGHMTVTSFQVDGKNRLKVINSQSSMGAGPCHVSLTENGDYLFTANYSTGNIAAFPIGKDGSIQQASSVVQSSGTGPVENRQAGPHTHYVTLDLPGNFLLSPDLGSDKVLIYRFDHDNGVLIPNPEQPFLQLEPGSGPRHLALHPTRDLVFVVNELNPSVTSCRYDETTGKLTGLHSVSTERSSLKGIKYSAAIRVHPDGKYIYASTRGENSSLTAFELEEYGTIFRVQVVEEVPGWPRDFNIDPSGNILLVAGERSHEIEMYRIDRETGKLAETHVKLNLPAPGCILFID